MSRPPDCGALPPDPSNAAEWAAFLKATQWMIGTAADVAELADMGRSMLERELTYNSSSMPPQLAILWRAKPDQKAALALHVLAVPFNTADEKRAVMRRIARGLHAEHKIPLAACIIAEAWSSTAPPVGPRVEPRLDPNRREVLVAQAAANSICGPATPGDTRLVRVPVKRGPNNEFVQDGDFYDTATDPEAPRLSSQLLRWFFLAYVECCATRGAARQAQQGWHQPPTGQRENK